MGEKLRIQIEKLLFEIRSRRRLHKVIGAMAVVVVVCIAYVLTKPAITMERKALCGVEDHIHTEECYADSEVIGEGILSCRTENLISHKHSESCYDEKDNLVCGYGDFVVHIHEDACYDTDGGLVCLLPEIEEHQHDDMCYGEVRTLVCEEKKGHSHEDSCYEWDRVLACGQEEAPAEGIKHKHTDICYEDVPVDTASPSNADGDVQETVRVLVCGYEDGDVEGHIHTDSCYHLEKGALICTLEETDTGHVHDDSCYETAVELVCNKPEAVLHTHDDTCYDEEEKLICGKVEVLEHTHSELCLMDNAIMYASLVASGTFGEGMTWAVEEDESRDYVLRISGEGPMPDYKTSKEAPWYNYYNKIRHIVVEDGVTRIGSYAFQQFNGITTVTLADTLEEIGNNSFYYCSNLLELEIPGSVRVIEGGAFDNNINLKTVIFHEGLEEIAGAAFNHCVLLSGQIELPATLKTLAPSAFTSDAEIDAYSVPEENESFSSEEGVLFNKDKTTLLRYPGGKAGGYIVPDTVTKLEAYSFDMCDKLTSVEIPVSVKVVDQQAFRSCSSLSEITFPELDSLGAYAMQSCSRLSKVTIGGIKDGVLSDNVFLDSSLKELTVLDNSITFARQGAFSGCSALNQDVLKDWNQLGTIATFVFTNCRGLTEITIPQKVTKIYKDAFQNCSNLKVVHMNAVDCSDINSEAFSGALPHFTMEIGEEVEMLRGAFLSAAVKGGCENLKFAGPNQLTVEEVPGSLRLPYPFSAISGLCYVDENGVLYQILDDGAGNLSAVLAYCPPDLTEYTVPESLTLEDATVCGVTGVGPYAFNQASSLTTLTFANPEAITSLADNAFANCTNLASINGAVTEAEAWEIFKNCTKGFHVFYRTKLSGGAGDGIQTGEVIEIVDGLTLSIETRAGGTIDKGDDGTFRYYTGESAATTISVSNPAGAGDSSKIMRIYVEFSDFDGGLNNEPGKSFTVEGHDDYRVWLRETDVPGIYYYEFGTPGAGDTISFPFQSNYPSPSSVGGKARIWGVVMTEEEALALGTGVSEVGSYHLLTWETKADVFIPVKTLFNNINPTMKGLGTGDGFIAVSGLSYSIDMERQGDTLEGIGKDLIKTVDFEDEFTFPEGLNWHPDVAEAVRAGDWWFESGNTGIVYVRVKGEERVLFKIDNASLKLHRMWVSADDSGNMKLGWSLYNSSTTTEMGFPKITLTIGEGVIGGTDADLLSRANIIKNTVTAVEHFTHSEDKRENGSCEITVTAKEGSVQLTKSKTEVRYWGEDLTYSIYMENPDALNYTQLGTLDDKLNSKLYIKPENMEKMFQDSETGKKLSIRIENAALCAPVTGTVTAVDGKTSLSLSAQNTGTDTPYHDCEDNDSCSTTNGNPAVLTLRWNPEQTGLELEVDRQDGNLQIIPVSGSIGEALDGVGYVVVDSTQYYPVWTYGTAETPFVLYGGQKIVHTIPATVKDTFMRLGKDWPLQHPIESDTFYNIASSTKRDGSKGVSSGQPGNTAEREFSFGKSASKDGKELASGFQAGEGDVLDYKLSIVHRGSGISAVLPLTDHMSGNQVLLAPVADNAAADWTDKVTRETIKEQEYYKFDKPGIYKNVWLGGRLADSVTVTGATETEEFSTLIKWYYAGFGGARSEYVTYSALVVDSKTVGSASSGFYTIGNEAWLGDHQAHRLWGGLSGGGTIINFDKKILEKRGETSTGDVVDEDDYSLIEAGNQVTYRLKLENKGDYPVTLPASQIYDMLPGRTGDVHQWIKGQNITLEYKTEGKEKITVKNAEDWDVTRIRPDTSQEDPDWQYLCWGDTFSVEYQGLGTLYIYVTLTFPQGDTWSSYCQINDGIRLENKLYVYHMPVGVSHDLVEPARVLLQKGVYETGQHGTRAGTDAYVCTKNNEGRSYYANDDNFVRTVTYYATLYNGGNTRLYLNALQDILPKGFKFHHLVNTAHDFYAWNDTVGSKFPNDTVMLENIGTSVFVRLAEIQSPDDRAVVYKEARVTASKVDDQATGRQKVTFTLSDGNLSLDKGTGKYYLMPGEAVVFGYTCYPGESAGSEDEAVNRIVMPYYDAFGGGVVADTESKVTPSDRNHLVPNDGSREVLDSALAGSYGYFDDADSSQWLSSDVEIRRGNVRPGITKEAVSVTNSSGDTTKYSVSALPTDIINWKITATNSGNLPLLDYTLTDTMKLPYRFTGAVEYNIYDSTDNQYGWGASGTNNYLFKIAGFSKNADGREVLRIESNSYVASDIRTFCELTMDGDTKKISVKWIYSNAEIELGLGHDASGNAVLTVHIADKRMAIPEGGRGIMTISTVNDTEPIVYENTVYLNKALLTPNIQAFDQIGQGNLEKDEDGNILGVRSSAQITVASGYATSSEKRVTEKMNADNTATSTGSSSYILLEDKTGLFTYMLTVNNITDRAMSKLIMIDNLPEVGDHNTFVDEDARDSEFKVSLAATPDFKVTVKGKDGGTETQLDPGQYTIEYSEKTEFTSEDWNGNANPSSWNTTSPEAARSIRLIINDPAGTAIPAGSSISLSFDAKVDDPSVRAGQTAWNGFGYHYSLDGVATELEAAPLEVGVKFPSVPILEKHLVDGNGEAVSAEKDETFEFLVYTGNAVEGMEHMSMEELAEALKDRSCTYVSVPVKKDASAGTSTLEGLMKCQYNPASGIWEETADEWSWINGDAYTVGEVSAGSDYDYDSIEGRTPRGYTFTYDSVSQLKLKCVNTQKSWGILLQKVDEAHKNILLSGAMFGLYSPLMADQMSDEVYGTLPFKTPPSREIDVDGTTYYLSVTDSSGADGLIKWEELNQSSYLIKELRAPDGYYLDMENHVVTRPEGNTGNFIQTVTVKNRTQMELPMTGGVGARRFLWIGLLFIMAAALLYTKDNRIRKKRQ